MSLRINHVFDAITPQSGTITFDATGSLVLPRGNTDQRPATPAVGMVRYNHDTDALEYRDTVSWKTIQNTDNDSGLIWALIF